MQLKAGPIMRPKFFAVLLDMAKTVLYDAGIARKPIVPPMMKRNGQPKPSKKRRSMSVQNRRGPVKWARATAYKMHAIFAMKAPKTMPERAVFWLYPSSSFMYLFAMKAPGIFPRNVILKSQPDDAAPKLRDTQRSYEVEITAENITKVQQGTNTHITANTLFELKPRMDNPLPRHGSLNQIPISCATIPAMRRIRVMVQRPPTNSALVFAIELLLVFILWIPSLMK
jgi:hypothetical protein